MPVVGEPIRGVPLAKADFQQPPRTGRRSEGHRGPAHQSKISGGHSCLPRLPALDWKKNWKRFWRPPAFLLPGPMSKGMISESNPLYLGMYAGDFSTADVRKVVEGADLVLNIGGELFLI